jgi:ATP-dependent exoDNAse (exonuclease V) beta subunit
MSILTPESVPQDQSQRLRALSVTESFIVQAPAGSGKTSLLVERYLHLLATVRRPEEILAITFTRAAAMEMKQRVLSALQKDTPLIQAIRQQDAANGWLLAQNPNLLKIQTIDSFATELATQIPGNQSAEGMAIEDKPRPLYLQAAQNVLSKLFTADPSNFYVGQFLQALDNNADSADKLLTGMLAKRDQWLDVSRRITGLALSGSGELAGTLNDAVNELRETLLAPLDHRLNNDDRLMVTQIAQATDRTDHITALLPLILTQKGTIRKSVDRRQGEVFTDKAFKGGFLDWLETLQQRDLASLLSACAQLPGLQEEPEAFDTLIATAVTLAMAAAELESLLGQRRCLDFTGMLMRASAGLEDEHGPTDLALYWDYRINHLLVDEFQDTSRSQFDFFNRLTAGWAGDDARTFFAVGDPMQSVYRFRDADVSIFSQCWQQGLPNVALEPLQLTSNFRSNADLVDWNNALFSDLFPADALPHLGAIPFSQAIAQYQGDDSASSQESAIVQHVFANEAQEAAAIADYVGKLLAQLPDDGQENIGILCRARSHLPLLLQALKQADIAYTSTDIDSLSAEPIVTDLLSLHRMLLQPSHRLSWFSILRSPMVGLSLSQLERIAEAPNLLTACEQMMDTEPNVLRFMQAQTWAQQRLFELPVCEIIEGCWMRLGGMDAYPQADLAHAHAWFDLLEAQQDRGWHPELVLEKTADLYAQDPSQAKVKVMTIHKSKGLEFTHVILPNLGRRGRADDKDLLLWRPSASGLLVGVRDDAVYQWLRFEENSRSENEVKRLLYGACTRAEQSLWLSTASLRKRPRGLAQYLPALAAFEDQERGADNASSADDDDLQDVPANRQRLLKHLPADYQWQVLIDQPERPQAQASNEDPEALSDTDEIEDDRSNRFNLALGNLVHQALAFVGEQNQQDRPLEQKLLADQMRSWLPKLDAEPHQWRQVFDTAAVHVQQTLADPTGCWLLQAHLNGHFEWPVTVATSAGPRKLVFDRIFRTDDAWWIIDFKTSVPTSGAALNESGAALNDFLAEETIRYSSQLQRYRQALSSLIKQCPEIFTPAPTKVLPVKTALYFTGISHFEELLA